MQMNWRIEAINLKDRDNRAVRINVVMLVGLIKGSWHW